MLLFTRMTLDTDGGDDQQGALTIATVFACRQTLHRANPASHRDVRLSASVLHARPRPEARPQV